MILYYLFSTAKNFVAPPKVANVESVKNYLKQFHSLRIFLPNGPGFGDQVFGINVMEYLMHHVGMQVKGRIEIIVPDINLASASREEQTLYKVAQLLSIDVPTQATTVASTTSTGLEISLKTFSEFKKKQTKIDLAIYTGGFGSLIRDFNLASIPENRPIYFDPLTFISIGHAERILYFNPFSFSIPGKAEFAAALGLKGVPFLRYEVQSLPYLLTPWHELPIDTIKKELMAYVSKKPREGQLITRLLELTEKNATNLFSVYGLHPSLRADANPHETIFNLILNSADIPNATGKPVSILLLNKIYPDTWQNLRKLMYKKSPPALVEAIKKVEGKIHLCEGNNMGDCLSQKNPHIYVANAEGLPTHLYRHLTSKKNVLPTVWEGANSFTAKITDGRYGLNCRRINLKESFEWDALSNAEQQAADLLCTNNDLAFWDDPTYGATFRDLLNQLNSSHAAPIPSEDSNRILYMAQELSKAEQCNKHPQHALCLFYRPTVSRLIMPTAKIAGQNYLFGGLESMTDYLLRRVGMPSVAASSLSSVFRILAQYYQAEFTLGTVTLVLFPSVLDFIPHRTNEARLAKEAAKVVLLFTQLCSLMLGTNDQTMWIMLMLMANAFVSDYLGRKTVEKLLPKIEAPKPKMNTPLIENEETHEAPRAQRRKRR